MVYYIIFTVWEEERTHFLGGRHTPLDYDKCVSVGTHKVFGSFFIAFLMSTFVEVTGE